MITLQDTLAVIRRHTQLRPSVAIVAGSGLSGLAARVVGGIALPYHSLPGWPASTVAGHAGELVIGLLGGRTVAVALGRAHLYEGYTMGEVTYNVKVFHALGARTLVVTNAAGGLNRAYRAGDLMVMADHIFLPGMAGRNPLIGANDEALGPRFPGMVNAYDPALRQLARRLAADAGFTIHEGVYAMVGGPSFETPAEARLLHQFGADAVGMSTAPEAVVARHAGMRVLGLSLITNMVPLENAALGTAGENGALGIVRDKGAPEIVGDSGEPGTDEDARSIPLDPHEEVLATGAAAATRMSAFVEALMRALPND